MFAGAGANVDTATNEIRFVAQPECWEEGGAPDIAGAVRAALAAQIHLRLGVEGMRQVCAAYTWRAASVLSLCPGAHPDARSVIPHSSAQDHANHACCVCCGLPYMYVEVVALVRS